MSDSTCQCNQENIQEKYQHIMEIIEEYKFKEGSLIKKFKD
ncbi:MAG: hypothetical protein PHP79_01950 [Clostridia bacterium]|nr:hypothetical protein [Clostridia bacterium]MDD4679641.1 hypothetical protein [Clostridia bacterium]